MAKPPTFFFSHARQDRETPGKFLRAFFEDLEIKLAQWAAVSLKERRLGTFDARVQQGENWDEDLSRGLSGDSCLVAILTPLYFNRPNCGKELAVFLLRSPGLGIDANGALTGVQNVMPIRWLPENAYAANAVRDALIPPILGLIEDTPADDRDDEDRTRAIERYRKKGMEKCVKSEPYYGELLDLFVSRIRDMADLPSVSNVSFASANDAFTYDWSSHFKAGVSDVAPVPAAAPVAPSALASVVVFYVTGRPFMTDSAPVEFADQLIAEPMPGAPAGTDPELASLLADVRAAGVAESLTVFHASASFAMSFSRERLQAQLASLSRSCVLTALVVDPAVWPMPASIEAVNVAYAVEQIIRSDDWTGPVLLPAFSQAVDTDELVKSRGLPSRLISLPKASDARLASLRRCFVDARGRVLRTLRTGGAPTGESLPVLKGVSSEDV